MVSMKKKPKKKSGKKPISFGTLNKYFRKAVLYRDKNTCQVCGQTDIPENLQAHHFIHRYKCRVLKYDIKNGFTVHCIIVGKNKKTCHQLADMRVGEDILIEKMGKERYEYIKELEQKLLQDVIKEFRITRNQFREYELKKLKNILDIK